MGMVNPGDILLAIDQQHITGRGIADAKRLIAGPPGTKMRLTVLRPTSGVVIREGTEIEGELVSVLVRILDYSLNYRATKNVFCFSDSVEILDQ